MGLARLKHQDNIASLRDSLAASERELSLQTRLLLQAQPAEARVCLLIDQFEEVFTLCQDQTERTQFMDALRYAATVACQNLRECCTRCLSGTYKQSFSRARTSLGGSTPYVKAART